ncbi:MAG TPA: hypothetical protein VFG15_30320 [Amycolatopsis sp.]|nr:hypothetical protein [Amycolatopsis sp.]
MAGITITNEQIFDELRALTNNVITLVTKLDTLVNVGNDHEQRIRELEKVSVADHESRIRGLERKIWVAAGVAAAGGGGVVQALHAVLGA